MNLAIKSKSFESTVSCSDAEMLYLNDRKSYVPMATCALEHILFNQNLSEIARLYYLLVDCIAHIHLATDGDVREAEKNGAQWGALLNRNSSYVYQIQKELEEKGYFVMLRQKTNQQHEVNRIIPTLPEAVYQALNHSDLKHGVSRALDQLPASERRAALDETKLFTKLNLALYKSLLLDVTLTPLQKLIWVYCFSRSYRSFVDGTGEGCRTFLVSFKQLSALFGCAKSTISKAFSSLVKNGFLSVRQLRTREQGAVSRRRDKSLWEVAALFPKFEMAQLKKQRDRANVVPINSFEETFYEIAGSQQPTVAIRTLSSVNDEIVSEKVDVVSEKTYGSAQKTSLHNKDHKTKIKKQILNIPEMQDVNLEPQDANANVFFEDPGDDDLLPILTLEQARQELKAFPIEQEIRKLMGAGLGEFFAKKQAVQRLDADRREQLALIAFSLHQAFCKQKQDEAHFSVFEIILIKEIIFPKLRVLVSEEALSHCAPKFNKVKKLPVLEKHNQRKLQLDPALEPYQHLKSLDPVDLVGTKYAKQIAYWLHTMQDRGEIKGDAQHCSLTELAEQIAFHAKTWQGAKGKADPIGFGIFVACKKMREGNWCVPFELPKAREAILERQKREFIFKGKYYV